MVTIIAIFTFLSACSQKKKILKANAVLEPITREEDSFLYIPPPQEPQIPTPYPWQLSD